MYTVRATLAIVTASPTPIPRALVIAWGLEEAPRRGPRRELTHDAIARAAVAIADDGGLGAVTMGRVAASLGFTTMSLYRYVSSKDELVMLMQDAATEVDGELEVSTDDWRQGLRDIAALHLQLYARHPWFLDVPLSLEGVLMPNNMRVADATYRAMRTLPADVAPVFRSGGYAGDDPGNSDGTDDFGIGLELFLSGLEAKVSAPD